MRGGADYITPNHGLTADQRADCVGKPAGQTRHTGVYQCAPISTSGFIKFEREADGSVVGSSRIGNFTRNGTHICGRIQEKESPVMPPAGWYDRDHGKPLTRSMLATRRWLTPRRTGPDTSPSTLASDGTGGP